MQTIEHPTAEDMANKYFADAERVREALWHERCRTYQWREIAANWRAATHWSWVALACVTLVAAFVCVAAAVAVRAA